MSAVPPPQAEVQARWRARWNRDLKEHEIENLARDMAADPQLRAPVQGYPGGVPWELHMRAYEGYCVKYRGQVALIDLFGRGCRGGFGTEELEAFVPGWRDELNQNAAVRRSLEEMYALVAVMYGRGPEAVLPEQVDMPLGPPVKLGSIMRGAAAALGVPPPAVEHRSHEALTSQQVQKHYRYRSLHEDFVTVETDLRNCAVLIGHHYNSLHPVADALKAYLAQRAPAVPTALAEEACTISKTGSTVTIECDEADEANQLFDWLSQQ